MAKKALAQQAYEDIKKDIVYNRLTPGAKLSISELKIQYGYGLSPLREALSRLAAVGLLASKCMSGYSIPPLSLENFNDLYKARMLIETEMMKESANNATEEDELRLVTAYHQFKKIEDEISNTSDFTDWQEKHRLFLDALLAGCHSPSLSTAQNMYYEQSERYRSLWFHYSGQNQHVTMNGYAEQHKGLYDAFMARDGKLLAQRFNAKSTEWQKEARECIQKYLDEQS